MINPCVAGLPPRHRPAPTIAPETVGPIGFPSAAYAVLVAELHRVMGATHPLTRAVAAGDPEALERALARLPADTVAALRAAVGRLTDGAVA
jgi:hypothetical protein